MVECICNFDGAHTVPDSQCLASEHRPVYRELLLGCGRSRKKQYNASVAHSRNWRNPRGPTTLDIDWRVKPDIWCDLNLYPPWNGREDEKAFPRVLEGDYWDEIHAYQVLEHLGQQGDASAFFAHFSELWRILKPDGYLVASVPSRFSDALWGDPSHRRAIVPLSLTFLDQGEYIRQCDGPPSTHSSMSDFRHIYKADFKICETADNRQDFVFVLQAIKPSRWTAPK